MLQNEFSANKVFRVPDPGQLSTHALETSPAGTGVARAGMEEAARRRLLDLKRKLRRERAMGRSGHWAYSLTRHLALTRMVKEAETAFRSHERCTAQVCTAG